MDGAQPPHSTVQAAARAFVHDLERQHLVPGVVRLLGHSFGGWLAFEMALRLQETGRRVDSLTMLDTECPGEGGDAGREYSRPEALLKLIQLYEQAAERPLNVRLADLEDRDPEAQLILVHKRLVQVGLMPMASAPGDLRGSVRTFESALRTQYRPDAIFRGEASLVVVPEDGEDASAAELRFARLLANWQRLAPRIQLRRSSGNHVTLLKTPNILSWLHCVRDRCQRQGAPSGPRIAPREAGTF
jgi:arthrofactin-type cyclic lipopeptide synthetase C